ncbi:MAG: DUF4388 domain-containing protein [bacterium]
MPVISKLTKCLLQRADINEFQLLQAEDYALTRKIPLEDALLFLEYVDFSKIGECLSLIHEKPYIPLVQIPLDQEIKQIVPVDLAQRYTLYPTRFDRHNKTLLLAVSDPAEPVLAAELPKVLPPEYQWNFSVAPAGEIKQAIEVHYLGRKIPQTCKIDVPEDFVILPRIQQEEHRPKEDSPVQDPGLSIVLLDPDRRRAGALRTLLQDEGYNNVSWALSPREAGMTMKREGGDLLLVNGALFKAGGAWLREVEIPPRQISFYEIGPLLLGQEYAYGPMSDSLVEMVAFWVRRSLHQNPELLQETLNRVKYCKLLGLRIRLDKTQLDGVVLAAWLSAGSIGREAARVVPTPYRVEEILRPGENARPESDILKLVVAFQMLLRKNPQAAQDLGRLRKAFVKCLDSAPDSEALVETFLRILKEEEFLGQVGQGVAARIVMVDPEAAQDSPLFMRLKNEGYVVVPCTTPEQALENIMAKGAGLIISELDIGDGKEGLELCRRIRKTPELASVPFIVLTGRHGDRLHAESLGAGADDFLTKPPDLEVLCLKIKRLLAKTEPRKSAPGVRGSLQEMSSVDFLQSLAAGEKDVEIVIENGQQTGRIFMKEGAVIHAELADLQGEEAFYGIVPWEEGDFVILPCSNFPEQTIQVPLESMLIEGFRRVDEENAPPEPESEKAG